VTLPGDTLRHFRENSFAIVRDSETRERGSPRESKRVDSLFIDFSSSIPLFLLPLLFLSLSRSLVVLAYLSVISEYFYSPSFLLPTLHKMHTNVKSWDVTIYLFFMFAFFFMLFFAFLIV